MASLSPTLPCPMQRQARGWPYRKRGSAWGPYPRQRCRTTQGHIHCFAIWRERDIAGPVTAPDREIGNDDFRRAGRFHIAGMIRIAHGSPVTSAKADQRCACGNPFVGLVGFEEAGGSCGRPLRVCPQGHSKRLATEVATKATRKNKRIELRVRARASN